MQGTEYLSSKVIDDDDDDDGDLETDATADDTDDVVIASLVAPQSGGLGTDAIKLFFPSAKIVCSWIVCSG